MRSDPLVLDILFLLHIGKDWFLESKLSVVVPQAIGISLRNRIGDSAGEFLVVVLWGLISQHSMYLNCSFSLISVSGLGACMLGRVWLVWILSHPIFLPWVYAPFLPVRGFLIYSRVYTQFPLWFLHIHAGLLRTVTYTLGFAFLWKIIGYWVNYDSYWVSFGIAWVCLDLCFWPNRFFSLNFFFIGKFLSWHFRFFVWD